MPDYGRDLQFGIFPTPVADHIEGTFAMVAAAEAGGLDLVGVQDHPYQRRFVDAFVLIGAMLARTERIRAFPDVANVPLRTPAMIAKQAASLDLLSGGRFELGLGAGAFWTAIAALGGPDRSPRDAAQALHEAVEVTRLLWSGAPSVRFEGRHYRLAGTKPGPAPAHRIGIWLGVGGPRNLDFLGRAADGWIPSSTYFPPETLAPMQARIDDGAHAAGRRPSDIQRLYNVMGVITKGESRGFLHGPVEQWVEELTALVIEQGMDTFVYGPAADPVRQVEVFAAEVVPAVRATVAAERGTASG